MLNTVVLSINNWCQVNSKWTVTAEGVRPTDVFFLRFFVKFFNDYLNTEYTFYTFFFFSPETWTNSLCPANMVIYSKENTMNPHKEKIIINRNISEIPFNDVYLILSPRPPCLFVVLYISLLSALDLCVYVIVRSVISRLHARQQYVEFIPKNELLFSKCILYTTHTTYLYPLLWAHWDNDETYT